MKKDCNRSGFTLVEVLIIAPIVVLVISVFVAFIVNITGEVLKTRASIESFGQTRSALDFIQSDAQLSAGFAGTTGVVDSPQGSDNGTAAWTNSGATTTDEPLIITRLATNKNPIASDSAIVYTDSPNSCGGSDYQENTAYSYYSVYFIQDGTLWQRNVMPGYPASNLCATPWQLPSCAEGETEPICISNDVKLVENVTSFDVEYIGADGNATDVRSDAVNVDVTIDTSKNVVGQSLPVSNNLRIAKRGSAIVAEPNGQYNIGWTFPDSTPTTPRFHWSTISSATSYDVRYRVNGGGWSSATNVTATNYTYSGAEVYRNDTVGLEVTAKNGATVISTSNIATATIPKWVECQLQNGWLNHDLSWGEFKFTKTSGGIVFLSGLVDSGNNADYTTICTLPPNFRPTHAMLFRNHSNTGVSHVYILPDGRVQTISAGNGWYSLSNVSFLASGSTAANSLANLTLLNGWTRYDMSYDTLRSAVDSVGRVHIQGLVNPGTTTAGTAFASLPAAQQSNSRYYHIAVDNCGTGSGIYLLNQLFKSNGGNCWHSSQFMYYPDGVGTWTDMTLQNGWVEYSASYRPQYTKAADGVVTLRGLVKSGTTGCVVTVTNLPSGYRPLRAQAFIGYQAVSGTMAVYIYADGNVRLCTTENTYNSLDNISFIAEQ